MRCALLALPLAGCVRAPIFYGLWDIDHAKVGDQIQHEVGSFEIGDDDSISLILSYDFAGAFTPDPSPAVVKGGATIGVLGTDEDPVYDLLLSPFGQTPFDIVEYRGTTAVLRNPSAVWPGSDPASSSTFELTLTIAR